MFEESEEQLQRLASFLRIARKRRGWTQQSVANRLQISLDTVKRAERGEPGIKIGTLLTFLALYQRLNVFADVIDPDQDRIGISLANERLPKRVREQKYDRDF
jgi:transcriptional regulator with XRE-family HTH domain